MAGDTSILDTKNHSGKNYGCGKDGFGVDCQVKTFEGKIFFENWISPKQLFGPL